MIESTSFGLLVAANIHGSLTVLLAQLRYVGVPAGAERIPPLLKDFLLEVLLRPRILLLEQGVHISGYVDLPELVGILSRVRRLCGVLDVPLIQHQQLLLRYFLVSTDQDLGTRMIGGHIAANWLTNIIHLHLTRIFSYIFRFTHYGYVCSSF